MNAHKEQDGYRSAVVLKRFGSNPIQSGAPTPHKVLCERMQNVCSSGALQVSCPRRSTALFVKKKSFLRRTICVWARPCTILYEA